MFFLCCVSCRVYFVGCRCIVIALHILYYTQHLTSHRAQTSIACIWFPIWLFLYFLFIFLCCVISARCFFFYFLYRSIQYYRHIDNVLCTDRAHCTLHNILTQFRVIISNAIWKSNTRPPPPLFSLVAFFYGYKYGFGFYTKNRFGLD